MLSRTTVEKIFSMIWDKMLAGVMEATRGGTVTPIIAGKLLTSVAIADTVRKSTMKPTKTLPLFLMVFNPRSREVPIPLSYS